MSNSVLTAKTSLHSKHPDFFLLKKGMFFSVGLLDPRKEHSFYKHDTCGGRESEAKSEQSKKDFLRILTICLIFSDFCLLLTVGFS